MTGTILVTSGTGKTGRRVARRLAEHGVPVRVGSRAGRPPFDWTRPGTWAPALRGAEAVYIAFHPDLALPGAAEAVGAFARLAVRSAARRLVLLSGRGEEGALRAEREVAAAGADWTVLRAAWLDQNFSEGLLAEPVMAGELALPGGDVREPFVDAEDVAEVAVAALTAPGHAGRTYELTGPRAIRLADAAAEIARAAGRPVRYRPASVEECAAGLARQGLLPEEARLLAGLLGDLLDGRNAGLGDGVPRVLGRPARDFSRFARAAAAAGAWRERAAA